MKALLQKELRENLKLAALGLVVFGLLLWFEYRDFAWTMKELASHRGNLRAEIMQPLISPLLQVETAFFCGIFGAILGWLQVYHERQRDLWSFLVHRPMKRSRIFLCKVAAGLVVYALVAGLPLVLFVVWARTPGQVPAPFEWRMLLPLVALVLGGFVYYFAGMLTGLRQARWYASRGLPLVAGILVSLSSATSPYFWRGLLIIVGGAALFGIAAWGSFGTNGFYRGQRRGGKLALTASLVLGSAVIMFLVTMVIVTTLFPRWFDSSYSWASYLMTRDGKICKSIQGFEGTGQILDLEGKPMKDPKTGRPLEDAAFNRLASRNTSLSVNLGERFRHRGSFGDRARSFASWNATPDTLWYYWPLYGRLVAYDLATRRPAGSLGPNGLALDFYGGGERFDYEQGECPSPLRTVKSATTLYRVDLENRAVIPLFTTTKEDPIVEAQDIYSSDNDWDYTLLVTRGSVHLLTPDGKLEWKRPYEPGWPEYNQIMVSFLEPPHHFALWLFPSGKASKKADWKLPVQVTWLAGDSTLKTAELPDLSRRALPPRLQEKALAALTAPTLIALAPWALGGAWRGSLGSEYLHFLWLSLAMGAIVCVPVGLLLGRHYSFGAGQQLGWGVFHLLTGVPGLLAFLSVQEWPARERCANCQRLRVVEREHCEHCGAEFPPPERTGVEIFAAASAAANHEATPTLQT